MIKIISQWHFFDAALRHFQFHHFLLIFLLLAPSPLDASNLSEFSEDQVWSFIRAAPNRHFLNLECAKSLGRVEIYLKDQRTLEEQRHFFFQAFSTGDAQQFISRDQDRWLFNAFKCIKAAGESSYSASEYPLHYCYGQNHGNESSAGDIAYGMCIPSPCSDQKDRLELLREWQLAASNGTDNSELEFGDCTKSRHSKQWWEQPIPLVHFSSDLVLIAIVGVATALHWRRGDGQFASSSRLGLQLLLSFSAKRNVQKLVQMPKDRMSTITCFFGLRFGAMVWTLVGHSFIFVQAFLSNVEEFKTDLVDNFWSQWITNFTLSVDVFLVLSGTLTAYSWFRRWQHPTAGSQESEPGWTSWAYWLRFYRHRVVRLWPAYIYTLIAVTTRVSISHYHPMWPPTDPAVQCPKHWWENVLFINSLTDNRCMPWTWYIGTEFLFYLLSPIFLLSLRQSPKAGFWLCSAVCALSALLNVVTMIRYNFPPTQMLWKQPAIFSPDFILHHLVIYIKPWYRIGPYIVGIVLGYFLAIHSLSPQQKRTDSNVRSKRFIWSGWTLATVAGFWSIFGLYPALQGMDWPFYHLFYGSMSRTVFAIALAWLIYACHTGIGGPLNWVLSLGPLLPLSNLSYTAYLFHMVPVVFTYVISPFPMHFDSKLQILQHCFIQLAISYCYAILCTLLAELPALNIERVFLNRSHSNKSQMQMLNANGTSNGGLMVGHHQQLSIKGKESCPCAAEEHLTGGRLDEMEEQEQQQQHQRGNVTKKRMEEE